MSTDEELLRLFAEHRDEAAFAEIVQRHAGLVLGVARRRVQDMESAQDVAQQVFTLLAAKAASLHRSRRLAGWLHRTTILTAGNALRSARRRHLYHEAFASEMKLDLDSPSPEDAPWREALPLIDAAIDSLSATDREVVLGHYFQRRAFRDLAASAGKSDHAMQKRASRALDKLSAFLRRRGITISASALAGGLGAHTAEAAPAGFVKAAAATAVQTAPSLSAPTLLANTIATMTITKITAATAVVAFLLPVAWPAAKDNSSAASRSTKSVVRPAPRAGETQNSRQSGSASAGRAPEKEKSALGNLAGEIAKLEATNDPALFLRVKRMILELPVEDLPMALDLVKAVRNADALELSRAVFGRWGELSPLEGLAIARLSSTLAWRVAELARMGKDDPPPLGLFEAWVLRDAEAALAAAEEWDATTPLRNGRPNGEVPHMLANLAILHPEKALRLAAGLREEAVREPAERMIQGTWALQDPEAALKWLSGNAPAETRHRDLAWMLRSITASQPERAFSLARTIENPHARAEAVDFTLINWATDKPPAALDALLSLPDEELTPYLVRHAAVFLAGSDYQYMAGQTHRFPAGERREVFAELVVRSWPSTDKEAIHTWLNGIEISQAARRRILVESGRL